jgi:elongation factor Ts
MAKASLEDIQKLREMTSMGMMDCKKALEEANGDIDMAIDVLRKKGAAVAAKRGGNATSQGLIHAYIHPGATLGVLIEINCETDFVARNEELKKFAHDVCMHIAAIKPLCLAPDEVDPKWLEKEKEIVREQLKNEGKKEEFIEKILEGKVQKLYADNCLLQQKFVKNDKLTVEQVLQELVGKMGESIKIRRFVRYEIGA